MSQPLCNFDGAPRLRNHNSDMGVKCECESEARDLARHMVDQTIQKKAGLSGEGCETGSTKARLPPKTMPRLTDHFHVTSEARASCDLAS